MHRFKNLYVISPNMASWIINYSVTCIDYWPSLYIHISKLFGIVARPSRNLSYHLLILCVRLILSKSLGITIKSKMKMLRVWKKSCSKIFKRLDKKKIVNLEIWSCFEVTLLLTWIVSFFIDFCVLCNCRACLPACSLFPSVPST